MKIHRIDHVGVVVNDLPVAKAFFLDFGLEMLGEGNVEGEWVERIIGLQNVKVGFVLRKNGAELIGEIQNYENAYKLCYVRGPEGIILELAEKIK